MHSADGLVVEHGGFGADAVPYDVAWARQRQLHAARRAGEIPDTVLLLEHLPVYTAGRRTNSWERPRDGTPVVEVDRGGRITWHGPGQLVGYPILALPHPMDVVAHVRRVEQVVIDVCAELGLTTERVEGRSGVWVPGDVPSGQAGGAGDLVGGGGEPSGRPARKVAAIGVRVAGGVTMHGFALNCDPDLRAYEPIVACGILDAGVTSLSAELGRPVSVAEVLPRVERHLPGLLARRTLLV